MEFTDLVNMFFSVGAKEKHDEVYGIKLNFKYVTTTNTLGRQYGLWTGHQSILVNFKYVSIPVTTSAYKKKFHVEKALR